MMQSSDWNKQYDVLHISRTGIRLLGFSEEEVCLLTDAEMQAIADSLHEDYNSLAGGFGEAVAFITRLQLAQKAEGV